MHVQAEAGLATSLAIVSTVLAILLLLLCPLVRFLFKLLAAVSQ